jgi:aminoglycoside 6-adenylyltransferase
LEKQYASTYTQLEANAVAWAQGEPGIRAVVLVGSRARLDHPAGPCSDLDLVLFTGQPFVYATDPGWLDRIGETWLAVSSTTGRGDPEWQVLFAGGLKADFVLSAIPQSLRAEASLAEILAASPYGFVFARGLRVLVDKTGQGGGLAAQGPASTAALPTQLEFEAEIKRFWLDAARTASILLRGEIWRAKQLCDHDLKQRLLRMLEWQARAIHDPQVDTWHDGRWLQEWADPQALAALADTFAGYESHSIWQALWATSRLFTRLAEETAGRLGFDPYKETEQYTIRWITELRKCAEQV